jgi:hypothetical protein
MTEEFTQEAELRTAERLPWHRPEVQRLTISLDTRAKAFPVDGSFEDLENP